MLERQQLVCSLGAAVVMTDPEQAFAIHEAGSRSGAVPGREGLYRNSFGDAVRYLLSGTTCLDMRVRG